MLIVIFSLEIVHCPLCLLLGYNALFGRGTTRDEDIAEWYEEINGEFFEYIGFCKEETAKASRELHKIIDSIDPLMCSWRA